MSMQRILVGAALALALAFVASRWRWTSLPIGRVEVTGTVYLDGRPLTGHDGLVGLGSTTDPSESVAGWIDSGGRSSRRPVDGPDGPGDAGGRRHDLGAWRVAHPDGKPAPTLPWRV